MARLNNVSGCAYVDYGYGQVEPNHLSAQRTGQIYAQLPANADINLLENGQFAKYDYRNGEVNFTGEGEWMLVYNEVKVYREYERDCDFAMRKGDYAAQVYSPVDGESAADYQIVKWESAITKADPYIIDSIGPEDKPLTKTFYESPMKMPAGTTMVPRLLKTNVGDIFTTNTIKDSSVEIGNILEPGADGYLKVNNSATGMKWQVVKIYNMPDGQKGVKIMRIA